MCHLLSYFDALRPQYHKKKYRQTAVHLVNQLPVVDGQ